MIVAISVFYLIENWRGARAWQQMEAELAAKGRSVVVEDNVPQGVPDEDNIAQHPAVLRMMEVGPRTGKFGMRRRIDRRTYNLRNAEIPGISKNRSSSHWNSRPERGQSVDVRMWLDPPMPLGTEQAAARLVLEKTKSHFAFLDELAGALERPVCVPDYVDELWYPFGLPAGLDLGTRAIARNARHRSILHAKTGASRQCLDDLLLALRVSERLLPPQMPESGPYNCYRRLWSLSATYNALWEALRLHALEEEQLVEFQTALNAVNLREDLAAALHGECISIAARCDYFRGHRSDYFSVFYRQPPTFNKHYPGFREKALIAWDECGCRAFPWVPWAWLLMI